MLIFFYSQSQGKYLDAARAYDEVIKLAPNVAEVWLNRGGMFYFNLFIYYDLFLFFRLFCIAFGCV